MPLHFTFLGYFLVFRSTCYHRYMNYLRLIRLTWLLGLGSLVLFLLYRGIVPFGSITYTHNFLQDNYFISPFSPKERLAGSSGFDQRRMIAEPLYFFFRTPRPFTTATVTVTYKNPAPFMELGICRDKAAWNFERQPVYSRDLENLATNPHTIQENGLLLWQKQMNYQTITDFLQKPPYPEKIAVYNYDLKPQFRLIDYKNFSTPRTIPVGLRGGYTMVTYTNGEPIQVTFTVHRETTADYQSPHVILYSENNSVVYEQSFFNEAKDFLPNSPQSFSVVTPILPSGPYRLEFKTNDQVVTDTIVTAQAKISFLGTINFNNSNRNSIILVTDGSYIKAQTLNPERLQTMSVDKQTLEIHKTYHQFSLSLDNKSRVFKTIILRGDDVTIASDGILAFSTTDSLNPWPRSYSGENNFDSDIEYILARYTPIGNAERNRRSITFTLGNNCFDKGRYPFLLSAPGITATAPVEIENISIHVQGTTLMEYIKKLWHNL